MKRARKLLKLFLIFVMIIGVLPVSALVEPIIIGDVDGSGTVSKAGFYHSGALHRRLARV